MSIDSFFDYLALEKKYSKHTLTAYRNDLLAFTDFCQHDYQIQDIDLAPYTLIRSWIVSLVEAGISNRTVNRKIASLKAYYKFLLQIEKISVSPFVKHKPLKVAKKVALPFSEKEMEALLNEMEFPDTFEGVRDRLLIELLYITGIRRDELIHLQIKNIAYNPFSVKVLGKRNKERIIPLLTRIKPLLDHYLDCRSALQSPLESPYLFLTNRGHKIYDSLVYRVINHYFSIVSSKEKRSPHILRHTFATHLLNQGADLNAVKELLGHASLSSTQVYTHNSIAELKKTHAAAHPRSKK